MGIFSESTPSSTSNLIYYSSVVKVLKHLILSQHYYNKLNSRLKTELTPKIFPCQLLYQKLFRQLIKNSSFHFVAETIFKIILYIYNTYTSVLKKLIYRHNLRLTNFSTCFKATFCPFKTIFTTFLGFRISCVLSMVDVSRLNSGVRNIKKENYLSDSFIVRALALDLRALVLSLSNLVNCAYARFSSRLVFGAEGAEFVGCSHVLF